LKVLDPPKTVRSVGIWYAPPSPPLPGLRTRGKASPNRLAHGASPEYLFLLASHGVTRRPMLVRCLSGSVPWLSRGTRIDAPDCRHLFTLRWTQRQRARHSVRGAILSQQAGERTGGFCGQPVIARMPINAGSLPRRGGNM